MPPVLTPRALTDCLDAAQAETALMLVEPAAVTASAAGAWPRADAPRSAMVLVGPEGGWANEEVAQAMSAGCLPVSLGPRTLRADAAAIVALERAAVRLGQSRLESGDSGLTGFERFPAKGCRRRRVEALLATGY